MALKKRQTAILVALRKLGGKATTQQIAEKADLNVNGVSQSLGAMSEYVKCLGGHGGKTMWRLRFDIPYTLPLNEKMIEVKRVLHHNDPPCNARLTIRDGGNWCPKCKLHPDMQSLCLWSYCPLCDIPLKEMNCPKCKQTFKSPFS